MIRTAWLDAFCLAGLGAVVAIEIGATPAPSLIEAALDQTTIGTGSGQDTLTKADKLEISYVRQAVEIKPVGLSAKVPPETSLPSPTPITKIASRHWHDPNAKSIPATTPHQKPSGKESKKGAKGDRPKATAVVKPCRSDAFGGLLRSLKLSPECEG